MQLARSACVVCFSFRLRGDFASRSTHRAHFAHLRLPQHALQGSRSMHNGVASTPSRWGGLPGLVSALTKRPGMVVSGALVSSAVMWAAQVEWRSSRRHASCASGAPAKPAHAALRVGPGETTAPRAQDSGRPLRMVAGAAMIPHPAKHDKGGEDAYFICEQAHCVGVADGVGGWAEIGVDAGLYSRELMKLAKEVASAAPPGPTVPQQALEAAHASTSARGSCTACIACLHASHLHASNLGDSGFMVVREGELAFMSPQQQHEFNFPYQIGSADSMGDAPGAAQRFSMHMRAGDILVLATDGFFDNVYPDEAAALAVAAQRGGDAPAAAAAALARFARGRAADPAHLSPFAYGAQQMGYRYFGGKMDDITVLVAFVEHHEEQPPPPLEV